METVNGIEYSKPIVTLLQDTGLGVAEYSARTCYDSFDNSENEVIKELDYQLSSGIGQDHYDESYKSDLNNIEDSELLDTLAWTYFHHSILEHANLSFLVKGTSRGVLQEQSRHRIQGISVRSTRYTMSNIINAFNSSGTFYKFKELIDTFDMFVVTGPARDLEIKQLYDKLEYQFNTIGPEEFLNISSSKEQKEILIEFGEFESHRVIFNRLQKAKKKRNVGDAFKWIVTDTWKVDFVCTFNLRSLKNYFDLRDSGAAYFQIQWLAKAMKEVTPPKYLKLIDKKYKD